MVWKIPILMYHSIKTVSRKEVMRSLHVSPAAFSTQMKILATLGYHGCSVSHAIQMRKNGCNAKLVALTFDDAYENFFSSALNVLTKYKFSATVYPVTNFIGGSNVWDHNSGISENKLMSLNQLRECRGHGIELGCHSASHQSLVEKGCDLDREITQSKLFLENHFDTEITSFCYPYGHYNLLVKEKISSLSFKSGLTMNRGVSTEVDDELLLPRIPITWHTLPHLFITKLLTTYEDRRRLIR